MEGIKKCILAIEQFRIQQRRFELQRSNFELWDPLNNYFIQFLFIFKLYLFQFCCFLLWHFYLILIILLPFQFIFLPDQLFTELTFYRHKSTKKQPQSQVLVFSNKKQADQITPQVYLYLALKFTIAHHFRKVIEIQIINKKIQLIICNTFTL